MDPDYGQRSCDRVNVNVREISGTGENEFPAEDDQSVGGTGGHVHEETRALGAHHEEREERDARERGADLAAATPLQVRAAEHQLGGQQGATVDHQVSGMRVF